MQVCISGKEAMMSCSRWNKVQSTDIQGRSQTYTAPCNGVVISGAQIGVVGVLPTTHAKTNVFTIFECCVAFYECLSSRSECRRCRRHKHLTNNSYFEYRKSLKTPIWAPWRDKNDAGSGISLAYLWYSLKCRWNQLSLNLRDHLMVRLSNWVLCLDSAIAPYPTLTSSHFENRFDIIACLYMQAGNSPVLHSARHQRPAREWHRIRIASRENVDNQTLRNTNFTHYHVYVYL